MKSQLLTLLLLLSPLTAGAEPLLISEDTECVGGEMVVDDQVTIQSGARLLLEDCTLVFDPEPYEDEWVLYGGVQGIQLVVEDGATLEVRAVEGDAGMRAADQDYAYHLLVMGDVLLQGVPGNPVWVSGLEGHITEANFDGGIKILEGGSVDADFVRWDKNQGPAVNAVGGEADVANALVLRNSGGVSAQDGTIVMRDSYVNVGIIGVFSARSDVTLDNTTIVASKPAIKAGRSDVTVTDSTLYGVRGAIEVADTNVTVLDSLLYYGEVGIQHDHKDSYTDRASVVVRNTTVQAFKEKNQSLAFDTNHADLEVHDSRLVNYTGFGINHDLGSVLLAGNTFDGSGRYDAALVRPRAYELANNVNSDGQAPRMVYLTAMSIDVLDDGAAVEGAQVRLPDNSIYRTNANGTAQFTLVVPFDAFGAPLLDPIDLLVEFEDQTASTAVPLSEQHAVVELSLAADHGAPGFSWLGMLVVLLGVALGARRKLG